MKRRVGILISGRGSNMMALVEAARAGDYPAEIALIVSSRPDAAGLAWAQAQGLPTVAFDHKAFATRDAFDEAINAALVKAHVELVALAGFMRLQSPAFVQKWWGRQINIHPSLLPLFKGLHPHQQALDAGVKIFERKERLLHAKSAVIDGVWSTVGSTNLDWRSLAYNDELNAIVLGPDFAAKMKAIFEKDAANSVAITPEKWAKRPFMDRVKETAAVNFSELL